jgi:ribosome biogenesis GTPase
MTEKKKSKKLKPWAACPVEAQYYNDDRKIARLERKHAKANDRSQYKKTDQKKIKEVISEEERNALMRGRVLSIGSQEIIVDHEGKKYQCMLRGNLKKDRSKSKNLVTVGDYVLFEEIGPTEGVIAMVEERQSTLSRADNLNQRKEQLIAANIDQVLITVSVVSPPLKPFLVDRFVIAAQKGNMRPVIVVNKIDLLPQEGSERELYDAFCKSWKEAGVAVVPVSAEKADGLDALKEIMAGKASVFSGQSGVGKSSLINAVTGLDLAVGDIVIHSQKGAHTTTSAQLLPLQFGGWVIDTPGIKSFGVWDLQRDELNHYFSDICAFSDGCKYPDCHHIHEKPCAVIDAVERGEISRLRYESYLYLIESIETEHKRR